MSNFTVCSLQTMPLHGASGCFAACKRWIIASQGSSPRMTLSRRWTENGERFSAARHPLAGIRASVGRRRGRTRGRASARDDLKKYLSPFTRKSGKPLCKGIPGGYGAQGHAHKPSPSLHTTPERVRIDKCTFYTSRLVKAA